jgi:hypothetical protein
MILQILNIEILNWPGPSWEVDLGGVKRIGRDEPVGVIIHISMETTEGNSLCSFLYFKLEKTSCFFFIFYVFSSTKLGSKRAEQVLPGEGGCRG